MKIYIATKWEELHRAREVMFQVLKAGHTITYDWTVVEGLSPMQATLDMNGVLDCDVFLFLAEKQLNYKGALVELGAAIATNKKVIVVGDGADTCLFVQHPAVIKVQTVDEALNELR